jgi:hypothetical protein
MLLAPTNASYFTAKVVRWKTELWVNPYTQNSRLFLFNVWRSYLEKLTPFFLALSEPQTDWPFLALSEPQTDWRPFLALNEPQTDSDALLLNTEWTTNWLTLLSTEWTTKTQLTLRSYFDVTTSDTWTFLQSACIIQLYIVTNGNIISYTDVNCTDTVWFLDCMFMSCTQITYSVRKF